jgi:hypothetical protein
VSGSTSFSYDTSEVAGIKVATRDVAGPTTKLAVISKAGTRYQLFPGLTTGLEHFAFKVRKINGHSTQIGMYSFSYANSCAKRIPTSVLH